MNTFETSTPTVPTHELAIPDMGQAVASAATLLLAAVVGFFKGMLLSGLLNLIPILPAVKRSTFSLMNRAFAFFLFAPASGFILATFPLLFIEAYRTHAVSFCTWATNWYGKTDLR